MGSLRDLRIASTYASLIKFSDESLQGLTSMTEERQLSDGQGNSLALYLGRSKIGIGEGNPSSLLDIKGSNQLRLKYNDSNYSDITTGSGGQLYITPSGSSVDFRTTHVKINPTGVGTGIGKLVFPGIDLGNSLPHDMTMTVNSTSKIHLNLVSGTAEGTDAAVGFWGLGVLRWLMGVDSSDGYKLCFGYQGSASPMDVGTNNKLTLTTGGQLTASILEDTGQSFVHSNTGIYTESFADNTGFAPFRKRELGLITYGDLLGFRASSKAGYGGSFQVMADGGDTDKQLGIYVDPSADTTVQFTSGKYASYPWLNLTYLNSTTPIVETPGVMKAMSFATQSGNQLNVLSGGNHPIFFKGSNFNFQTTGYGNGDSEIIISPSANSNARITFNEGAGGSDQWKLSHINTGNKFTVGFNTNQPQSTWESNGDFTATTTGTLHTGIIKSDIIGGIGAELNSTLTLSAKSDIIFNSNVDGQHGGGKDFIFKSSSTEVARIKANGDLTISGTHISSTYEHAPFTFQTANTWTPAGANYSVDGWKDKSLVPLFQGQAHSQHETQGSPSYRNMSTTLIGGFGGADGLFVMSTWLGHWLPVPCDGYLKGIMIYFNNGVKPALANWSFKVYRVASGSSSNHQTLVGRTPLQTVDRLNISMPNYNSGTPLIGGTAWVPFNQPISKGNLLALQFTPDADVLDEATHQDDPAAVDYVAGFKGTLVYTQDWTNLIDANIHT